MISNHQIRSEYARAIRDVRAAIKAAHASGNYAAAAMLRINLNLLLKVTRGVARRSA